MVQRQGLSIGFWLRVISRISVDDLRLRSLQQSIQLMEENGNSCQRKFISCVWWEEVMLLCSLACGNWMPWLKVGKWGDLARVLMGLRCRAPHLDLFLLNVLVWQLQAWRETMTQCMTWNNQSAFWYRSTQRWLQMNGCVSDCSHSALPPNGAAAWRTHNGSVNKAVFFFFPQQQNLLWGL